MMAKLSDTIDELSILIVDDDHWTTRGISEALKSAKSVEVAYEGKSAIRLFQESSPDVTLMDLNLGPGMGGIEAIEHIRVLDSNARIIVLTTLAPGPGLARALDAGAFAVVRKTATEETLREIVAAAMHEDDPRWLKHLSQDILISGDPIPNLEGYQEHLTPAEHDTLLFITQGMGYEEIAALQGVSAWTVRTHVKHLRQKLNAENLAQLVVRAIQYSYI